MNILHSDDPFDLALFFDLSPDLLCIAGYNGYFKKVNPTVLQVLGYSQAELMARPIDAFVHPEDRALTNQYRENLTQGIPLLNFENRYLSKGGRSSGWPGLLLPPRNSD